MKRIILLVNLMLLTVSVLHAAKPKIVKKIVSATVGNPGALVNKTVSNGIQAQVSSVVERALPDASASLPSVLLEPLTGQEVLSQMVPQWKANFAPSFSSEQLNLVEEAISLTDQSFFTTSASGMRIAALPEWDYSSLFSRRLYELSLQKNIPLSGRQYKLLLGGKGVTDFNLGPAMHLLSLEGWLLTHGNSFPRHTFFEDGRYVPAKKLTPLQHDQRSLAKAANHLIASQDLSNPIVLRIKALREATRVNELPLTPEEWLPKLEEWLENHPGKFPRVKIFKGGKPVPAEELSQEEYLEQQLGVAIDGAIFRAKGKPSAAVARMIKLRDAAIGRSKHKTPAELLAMLEEWLAVHGRLPKAVFSSKGKPIPSNQLTPAQLDERRLANAVYHWVKKNDCTDPAVIRMKELRNLYLKK